MTACPKCGFNLEGNDGECPRCGVIIAKARLTRASAAAEASTTQPPLVASSRKTAEDLLVSVCGFVTSLLTAVILWWTETQFGFAVYTWMFWFIIPVGALLAGFAGASGYYAGSWVFGHRPTRLLLINMVLVSLTTFLLIHYLSYISLEVEGKRVSDYIPFTQYLDIMIRSTSMEFRVTHSALKVGSSGKLGALGYIPALLQVAGFAAGGFAVYAYLASKPYCEKCSRYLSAKGKRVRYTGDEHGLQAVAAQVFSDLRNGAITTALDHQKSFGISACQGLHLRSVFAVRHCKKCGKHWVQFSVEERSGSDWKKIPELTAGGFTDQAVGV